MKKNLDESGEKTRICENCDSELIKKEIRAEINEELARVYDNIEIVKENYEKVEEERQEQSKLAADIEEQMMNSEKEFRLKENELAGRLNEVQLTVQKRDLVLENMRKEFDESRVNTKEYVEKRKEVETKIESMRNEVQKLKEGKSELVDQLDRINRKMVGGLLEEQVSEKLCETCRNRVFAGSRSSSYVNE